MQNSYEALLDIQEKPTSYCGATKPCATYYTCLLPKLLANDLIYQLLLKKIMATMIPNIIATPPVYFLYDVLYNTMRLLKSPWKNLTNYFQDPSNKQTASWPREIAMVTLSYLLALSNALFALGLLTLSSPEDILNRDYLTQLPHNPKHLASLIAGLIFFSYPNLKVNAVFARCFLTETFGNVIKNPLSLVALAPGIIAGLPIFAIGVDDLDGLHPVAGYALGTISALMFSITRAHGLMAFFGGFLDGTLTRDNERQRLNHEIKHLSEKNREKLNEQIKQYLNATHPCGKRKTRTHQATITFVQYQLQKISTYNLYKRALLPFLMFLSVSIVFGFKGLGTLKTLDTFLGSHIAPDDDDLLSQFGLASAIGCLSGIFYLMAAWRREFNDDRLSIVEKFRNNQPKKDQGRCLEVLNTTKKHSNDPTPYKNSSILRLQILAITPAVLMSWHACKLISQGNETLLWLTFLTIGTTMSYGAFDINRQAYLKQTYRKELKAEEDKVCEAPENTNNEESKKNPEENNRDYVEDIRHIALLNEDCIKAKPYSMTQRSRFFQWCCKPSQLNDQDPQQPVNLGELSYTQLGENDKPCNKYGAPLTQEEAYKGQRQAHGGRHGQSLGGF